MTIHGFYYFNAEGAVGYFDTPDDPYFLGPNKSQLGMELFGGNIGIGWHFVRGQFDSGDAKVTFDKGCRALYDATRTRVVAIGEKKPDIALPHNGAVYREEGVLDHIILLPPYVEHSFDGKTTERYPAESFVHLKYHDGKIALGVNFRYEWVQLRLYDPFTRQWGDIIGSYRM